MTTSSPECRLGRNPGRQETSAPVETGESRGSDLHPGNDNTPPLNKTSPPGFGKSGTPEDCVVVEPEVDGNEVGPEVAEDGEGEEPPREDPGKPPGGSGETPPNPTPPPSGPANPPEGRRRRKSSSKVAAWNVRSLR